MRATLTGGPPERRQRLVVGDASADQRVVAGRAPEVPGEARAAADPAVLTLEPGVGPVSVYRRADDDERQAHVAESGHEARHASGVGAGEVTLHGAAEDLVGDRTR